MYFVVKTQVQASKLVMSFNTFLQIEYQKQRKETIDNYRGFQTMDSSDHPVVQRGIKAAELISDVSCTYWNTFAVMTCMFAYLHTLVLTFDAEKLPRRLGLWQAVGLLSSPHHSWIWSSCWRQESAEWRKRRFAAIAASNEAFVQILDCVHCITDVMLWPF